jgi:exonuclease III
MRRLALAVGVALSLTALGCGGGGGGGGGMSTVAAATSSTTTPAPVSSTTTSPTSTQTVLAQGTIKFLTYNVAGLPQIISQVNPTRNTPLISPKLNTYDLVVVQEDFWYHTVLMRDATHPFQSQPMLQYITLVNDGLNTFSRTSFYDFTRVKWNDMHGVLSNQNDALSSKGFTAARHDLGSGVTVDVYNLHADAGGDQGDIDARLKNFAQLQTFMRTFSAGRPVIVAGDTNLNANRPGDMAILTDFLGTNGLVDSARSLGKGESLDRVMLRSTPDVSLEAVLWEKAPEFFDAAGQPLSDHGAVHVDILWKRLR